MEGRMFFQIVLLLGLIHMSQEHLLAKRRLDQFADMIDVFVGRSSLEFNDYGRWCGLGGDGDAVDAIDNCCKTHDMCYKKINDVTCRYPLLHIGAYVSRYKYRVESDKIECLNKESYKCGIELCKCDKAVVTCFKDNLDSYNKEHYKMRGTWTDSIIDSLLKAVNKTGFLSPKSL